MAPRGRTATIDDDVERSYESSPDPLALSLNDNTARPPRQTSPRKALGHTSPSKQNRLSNVSEFDITSPSKSMIVNTPRMGGASPWRIKVTVQAEPGSEEEQSPSVKRITRTQTTTVPLKDPDASSPVKQGRGRPRKSDVGVVGKPKRSGTPVKKAARSKSREKSKAVGETSGADVDTDVPPRRKRGRPRKSIQPEVRESSTAHLDNTDLGADMITPAITSGDAHDSNPLEVPDEDDDEAPQQLPSPLSDQNLHDDHTTAIPTPSVIRSTTSRFVLPDQDTPQQTSSSRRFQSRKGTPHAKRAVFASTVMDEDDEMDDGSDILTPDSEEEEVQEAPSANLLDKAQRTKLADPTPAPKIFSAEPVAALDFTESDAEADDEVPEMTYVFDEGVTRMADDSTMLESENFSMISVDSLPSSGGLTSPPKPEESQTVPTPRISSVLQVERARQPSPRASAPKDSTSSETSNSLKPPAQPTRPALNRYVTPVINTTIPAAPPAIEPVQPTRSESETPRIGRVVTAGVALQGVLDPDRLTPGPTQKVLDEERDRLDDLFRGFSEGTRKELQAGLRLGEQLAQGRNSSRSSPAVTDQNRVPQAGPSKPAVFRTERKIRQPRLLTPEDQEGDNDKVTAQPASNDVQYPSLDMVEPENPLLSPARSVDEMSWRVDTPPAATTGNTERMRMLNMALERGTTDEVANDPLQAPGNESAQHEDYSDIWQEEASRSSESLDAPASPKVQDLFESNLIAPARGKLPRTWRRTSGHHFQYSDEAESPQQAEADEQNVAELSAANLRSTHTEEEVLHEQDTPSEASDDTGIFFQSNLPNIFSKRHSKELKRKKADKLDLTLLMNEGQSMAPESSPPVPNKKSSSGTKNNPFLDTPPRFNAHLSSPKKSSPLRMELRESDISSLSPSHLREESSLPLPQSSPFHTHVEGISAFSVASDQRQLQLEMADVTASSIRRVRNEADEYLDAYEPQERSLDYIEEVTEPSRTWHRNTTVMASSPPQMKMLSPTRKRRPLFGTPEGPTDVFEQGKEDEQRSNNSNTQLETPPESSPSQVPPISEDPSSRPTGLLTRMTSSLWSAVTKPTPPTTTAPTTTTTLLPHPLLAKITPLPKLEPWTKTHYKTLDRLYKVQYKHETVFCPSANPPTPLSQTNAALLQSFLDLTGKPYIGAKFSAWGYEMDLTPELIVLCALFMELLSLDSIAEYETLKGREIELGDCAPGRMGEKIQAEEVVRRLATVVLGEEVRRDEKMGVEIDRSVGLEVEWPGR